MATDIVAWCTLKDAKYIEGLDEGAPCLAVDANDQNPKTTAKRRRESKSICKLLGK
jgi:hypothetical protein